MGVPITRNDLPEGWKAIAEEHLDDLIVSGGISQIKEKFGELRVYYDRGTEYREDVEEKMEEQCRRTCMRCGSTFGVSFNWTGWIGPMCDDHD